MTDSLQESLASRMTSRQPGGTAALEAKLSDQAEFADALKASLTAKGEELEQVMERLASLEKDLCPQWSRQKLMKQV